MYEIITSAANERIKLARGLKTKKNRELAGLFAVEGLKLVEEALKNGVAVDTLLFTQEFNEKNPGLIEEATAGCKLECTPEVLDSTCDTQTPQGVLALCALPKRRPGEYPMGLWAVLDGVQDPGNVGAIIRSADAFGAKGVLLSQGCADPYAPKTIRSAMGSTFHLPVVVGSLEEELPLMREAGFKIVVTHLKGEESLPFDKAQALALVIGSEGRGVSQAAQSLGDCFYRLAMKGGAESLNAAVFAGILLYEMGKRV